jgi:hypothetical protein
MADAEGAIGELKNQHGLDRVRCRGTPLFHVQLLLGCTALNCKRLADHAPQAQSGVAAGPQAAASDLRLAAEGACTTDRRLQGSLDHTVGSALSASPSTWSYLICLN